MLILVSILNLNQLSGTWAQKRRTKTVPFSVAYIAEGDFASEQEWEWDSAGGGPLKSVVGAQCGENNHNSS